MGASGTRWETARVEAFSDGVFAIAITLLVLVAARAVLVPGAEERLSLTGRRK